MKSRKIIRYSARYSKKARTRRFILNLLLILLIIAVVASLALIVTGYVIDDSSKPASSDSSISDTTSSDISQDVSSDTSDTPASEPSDTSSGSSDTSSASEPVSEPEQQELTGAITMPIETILSDAKRAAFLESAAENGYQAVVFEAKNTKGNILYNTEIELAARCGAVSANAFDLTALVDEIKGHGLKAVAMMSALQDPIAAHTDYGTSYTYGDSTYTWLDNSVDRGGKAWMNPYLENTQRYLNDITAELADAGCDSIIVTKLRFPTAYTSKLNQGKSDVSRQDMLSTICKNMQTVAGDCNMIFCFDAESYFGQNTDQYDGDPSGIADLGAIAPYIELTALKKAEKFADVDMTKLTAENVEIVLKQLKKKCPDAAIVPIFADEIPDEVIALLEQYEITMYVKA